MEQKNKLKLNSGGLLVFILTVGVFGIKPKHPWMRGRGAGYAESVQ